MSLEENIKKAAIKLGYESCGIISVDDFQDFDEGVEKHKAKFPHASQLYDSIKYMGSSKTYFPWGKSIIVCLEDYKKYHIPSKPEDFIHNNHPVGSRLDYPKSSQVKDNFQHYLKQAGLRSEEVKVPKRWAAVKAGLGKFRNNNFIYGKNGSWVTINTWIIDRKLVFEPVSIKTRFNCPTDCHRCIKACPTGALSAPMEMDVTKCKAYITYKEMMTAGIKINYGQCICDICQSVCPVNQKKQCKRRENEKNYKQKFNDISITGSNI